MVSRPRSQNAFNTIAGRSTIKTGPARDGSHLATRSHHDPRMFPSARSPGPRGTSRALAYRTISSFRGELYRAVCCPEATRRRRAAVRHHDRTVPLVEDGAAAE